MHKLINNQLPTIKEILKKNNVKIHKSLGQNFIFDINLTDKIVKKSEPISSTIIEIGQEKNNDRRITHSLQFQF